MSPVKIALFVALGIVALVFVAVWVRQLRRQKNRLRPTAFQSAVGFFTNFLDTLGIGSFATTTALYRLKTTIPDEKIPGTLNVGHAIPTITQAFVYISIIEVDLTTLCLLIAASVLGAWLGAGIVTRLPRRNIQIGMGASLLIAALLILGRLLGYFPPGNDATSLSGGLLVLGVCGNFVLGALMMIGVGAYAPIMIMVSLLGMNPKAAFPIMMGSCAFLMPAAGTRFIRREAYHPQAALGLTLAGVPAVLAAAFIVKELPLDVLRWLVFVVVIYTAISLLRSARIANKREVGDDGEHKL